MLYLKIWLTFYIGAKDYCMNLPYFDFHEKLYADIYDNVMLGNTNKGRIQSNDADIVNINTQIGTINTDISTISGANTTTQTQLDTVVTDLNTAETTIATYTTTLRITD